MPIGEAVGELLGGVLRVIGNIVVDLLLEVVIRTPGYFICHFFHKEIELESGWVVAVGVAFWVSVALAGYALYNYVS